MKLQEKKGVILFFWTNLLKRRKPQAKHRNKNAWVKPWLKNRADSNAYNNIFAELWLRDAEEGVPFRNVTRIQLLTWLKSEFFYMYFFKILDHKWRNSIFQNLSVAASDGGVDKRECFK